VSRSVSSPRVVLALGAVAGALALAGCGAGQITQTSSQVSGVGGGSANIGQIAIREAAFAFTGNGKSAVIYPQGGTAPLTMSVVNFGGQDDKLTGASSPAAESVTITGDATIASGRLLFVNGQPGAEQGSAGATATAAPGSAQATPAPGSALATPAPGGVTTAPAPASAQITARPGDVTGPPVPSSVQATPAPVSGANAQAAPPTGPLAPGTTTAQVVLTGLKQNLAVGPTYPVVLTFQRAGEVTVQVPVANPSENQGPTGE
jgi:copper(I)-binding protein